MLRCCKIYRCSQKLPLCNIKSRTLCQWVYQCQACGTWTTVCCNWRVSAAASWLPNVRTSRVWPTTYGIQHTLLGQSAIHRSHPGAETSIKNHNPSIKIWITSLRRSAVFCCCTMKCCCLGLYQSHLWETMRKFTFWYEYLKIADIKRAVGNALKTRGT